MCPRQIATACGGDVRKAINAVELLCRAAMPREGKLMLTLDDVEQVAQRAMRYDRGGDAMARRRLRPDEVPPGQRPGCGAPLPGPLSGGGGPHHPLPAVLCSASEDVGMAYPRRSPL